MSTKTRVVVVDDNPHIREIMASYIGMQDDMEVAGMAGDGIKGEEMIRNTLPDVVLLDMIMPKMDGLGVLGRTLRRRPP